MIQANLMILPVILNQTESTHFPKLLNDIHPIATVGRRLPLTAYRVDQAANTAHIIRSCWVVSRPRTDNSDYFSSWNQDNDEQGERLSGPELQTLINNKLSSMSYQSFTFLLLTLINLILGDKEIWWYFQ